MGIEKIIPFAGTAGSIIGAIAQGQANKKNMQFSREMYDRQRSDALTDLKNQNDYNSPAATMQRLKDANLNPNLAYGSGATTQSATVRSSSAMPANQQAAKYDRIGESLMDAYQIKLANANIKQIEESTRTQIAEQQLKAAQTADIQARIPRTNLGLETDKFNFEYNKSLRPISLEGAQLQNRKTAADIQYTNDNNERSSAMNKAQISQITQNIISSRIQNTLSQAQKEQTIVNTQNLLKDGRLKDLEIELKKAGFSESDPAWQKAILRAVSNPADLWNNITGKIKDLRKWINE